MLTHQGVRLTEQRVPNASNRYVFNTIYNIIIMACVYIISFSNIFPRFINMYLSLSNALTAIYTVQVVTCILLYFTPVLGIGGCTR